MKIFVTGATGFIGSHLVRRLVREGHEVACLVRKTSKTSLLEDGWRGLVYGDVNDREALLDGMARLRLAVSPGQPVFHVGTGPAINSRRVNIDGTRGLFWKAALEAGVKKVVYVSTVAVLWQAGRSALYRNEPARDRTCSASMPGPKPLANQIAWDLYRQRGCRWWCCIQGLFWGQGMKKPAAIIFRISSGGGCPAPSSTILAPPMYMLATWSRRCCARLKNQKRSGRNI